MLVGGLTRPKMGRPAAASRPPCNFASCAAPLIGTGIGASRWANKLVCAAPRDVKELLPGAHVRPAAPLMGTGINGQKNTPTQRAGVQDQMTKAMTINSQRTIDQSNASDTILIMVHSKKEPPARGA